jgi:hypothetical protein
MTEAAASVSGMSKEKSSSNSDPNRRKVREKNKRIQREVKVRAGTLNINLDS